MREILQRKNDVWKLFAYGCDHCEKTFKTEKYCSNHEEQCLTINTKKKLKSGEHMLIQRITKGNQSFFRQGQDGKLYKTREEAQSGGKKKGADGKACWEGYRYAGTKNGTDKCVKVKGR
jgi:hypothetical protein